MRLERLLPYSVLAAALVLGASELMTTFVFVPEEGGEALRSSAAADRHGYALLVLAGFAALTALIAVGGASKPAAMACGAAGILALGVFLVLDLPDVGQVGTLDDPRQTFIDARAEPRGGFWLALVGSLALAVTAVGLATLTEEQLRAIRPRWLQPPEDEGAGGPGDEGAGHRTQEGSAARGGDGAEATVRDRLYQR